MLNKKMKHNKIKNTGILFELLTRQITVDLMESDSSKAVDIVKKYFKNGTQLGKEYELYKILTETKYSTESRAEALIDAVMGSRKKLNNSTIKREKYNLIKEIRDCYGMKDFFNTKLPNYKVLASIYNIFEGESARNDYGPVVQTDSKVVVMENITHQTSSDIKKSKNKSLINNSE